MEVSTLSLKIPWNLLGQIGKTLKLKWWIGIAYACVLPVTGVHRLGREAHPWKLLQLRRAVLQWVVKCTNGFGFLNRFEFSTEGLCLALWPLLGLLGYGNSHWDLLLFHRQILVLKQIFSSKAPFAGMSFAPPRSSPRIHASPRMSSALGVRSMKQDALDNLPTEDLMHLKRSIDEKLSERRGISGHHNGLSQGTKNCTPVSCNVRCLYKSLSGILTRKHAKSSIAWWIFEPLRIVAYLALCVILLNTLAESHSRKISW